MTRFTKTVLTLTSISAALIGSAASAHAGDTFTATFSYDKKATAEANLNNFKEAASVICRQQIADAGFRKTDMTSYQKRKCERELLTQAVKGTNDRVLMSLYKSGGKTAKTIQLAMTTK